MRLASRHLVAASAALACGVVAGGCAHRAGKEATAGAIQSLETQSQEAKDETGQYILERAGSRVAQGVMESMTSPEAAERLQEIAGQVAEAAVARAVSAAVGAGEGGAEGSPIGLAAAQITRAVQRELARALTADLGLHGEGPLGRALVGTSAEISGSATRGVLQAFFPECTPGDPRCLDRRLSEVAQETALGAMRGFGRGISWLLIAGSFVAGVIATLLLVVTLRLFRRGGEPARRAIEQNA